MALFDPYHKWLGIPPEDQPPNHYRLLGIPDLESNPDVIDSAAEQRTIYLRTFQTGDQVELAEQLLNEVSAARVCLLDAEQKAEYDQQLQAAMQPVPVLTPVLVQTAPPSIAAEQPVILTGPPPVENIPPGKKHTSPVWQQPRILAAAGGLVAVALLLLIFLYSGGDESKPVRNPGGPATANGDQQPKVLTQKTEEEREAELQRLVEERVRQELSKAEQDRLAVLEEEARTAAAQRDAERRAAGKPPADPLPFKGHSGSVFSVLTLQGHSRYVTSVAFSPDGKRIVSGSNDATLKIWDTETRQETDTLKGHSDRVIGVAFSPDGKRIASGSLDKTLKVWGSQTGKEMLTLRGHAFAVWCVAFSPDGKRIVSGSQDKTLKIWDTETGKELLTLQGHTSIITSVAFSLDGRWIASGNQDKTLKVWDAKTGEEMATLQGHTNVVWCVAFSPDGKRLGIPPEDQPPSHYRQLPLFKRVDLD
jgi:hypothetical protein